MTKFKLNDLVWVSGECAQGIGRVVWVGNKSYKGTDDFGWRPNPDAPFPQIRVILSSSVATVDRAVETPESSIHYDGADLKAGKVILLQRTTHTPAEVGAFYKAEKARINAEPRMVWVVRTGGRVISAWSRVADARKRACELLMEGRDVSVEEFAINTPWGFNSDIPETDDDGIG